MDAAARIALLSPAKRALLEQALLARDRHATGIPKLVRRPEGEPLSYSQRRLWFLSRLGENSPAYNVVSAMRLRGDLRLPALTAALEAVIARHEALRTRFPERAGEPVQQVLPPGPAPLEIVTVASEAQLAEHLRRAAWTGFDLCDAPPIRFTLYRTGDSDSVLSAVMHHILSDGWSTGVFLREVTAFYRRFCGEVIAEPEPLAIQYADYTAWQRETSDLTRSLAYWKSHLAGMPGRLEFSADHPRPSQQTFAGRWFHFDLSPALTAALEQLAASEQATPFMVLAAAYGILLGRLTGQHDLGIGIPVAGRSRPELESLIGFFVNTLVLRLRPDPASSFTEYLRRTRRDSLDAFAHQDLPFERLLEEINPERDMSRNPLIQSVFAYQQSDAMTQTIHLPGVESELIVQNDLPVRFDLELHMWKQAGRFRGAFIYSTALFEHATIEQWTGHLQALLEQIATRPETPIGKLDILSPAQRDARERDAHGPANAFPSDAIHQIFERQARVHPDRIAITDGDESITYAALNRRSSRIAQDLRRQGIGLESVVPVSLPRSIELVATLLGILKAGAAYLPLDPANPEARNQAMIDDAKLGAAGIHAAPTAANAAYLNFTSGSTGHPKGVVITHQAVARLACNSNYVDVQPGDAFAFASNTSFDAATFELWAALLNGARLEVIPRDVLLDPQAYSAALAARHIDHVFMTTALFHRMVDAGVPLHTLRTLVAGGESLDTRRAAKLLAAQPPRHLVNAYGPTECTTFAAASRQTSVTPGDTASIGKPIANTIARILDAAFRPVPTAAEGLLYLSGPGLARGYASRPADTAAAFLPDPYGPPGALMYATGDRARYRANNEIEILGRADQQVKIRGFRIEPAETEFHLRQHPAVSDAAVIVRANAHGEPQLAAYVTAREAPSYWQNVFDQHVYTAAGEIDDPLFHTIGWLSSFDGCRIPTSHMRVWADDIVEQVLETRPLRVLELGFGTGMLLFRIAPHCEEYRGVDFSQVSCDYVQARIAERPGQFDHVHLTRQRVEELTGIEDNRYDAVILSSVAQYLPGIDTFLQVIEQGMAKLRPGGLFLLADLRNHTLLDAFHDALARHGTPRAEETELCIDPALFATLARRRPGIAHVRIRLQRTPHHNELSRYRFHAALTKGVAPLPALTPIFEDAAGLTIETLRHRIADGRLFRLPNARVTAPGFDPHDVLALAQSLGYRCEIACAPDAPDFFDAAFYRASRPAPVQMPIASAARDGDWSTFANQPLRTTATTSLAANIRDYLKTRLPAYLIPTHIVTLDKFPLGPTGKIDRKALPDPTIDASAAPAAPAAEPIADLLCGMVASLLGVDSVPPTGNFFELGGHSLLATTLASRIREAIGIEIPLKLIFEEPVLASLARRLRRHLEEHAGLTVPAITPAPRHGLVPASFAQRRLWFIEQMRTSGTAYNMPLLLELRGKVNVAALRRALDSLVERHQSLRTVFHEINGEPYQCILPATSAPFEEFDLTADPAGHAALVDQLLRSRFDLERDVMVRARLLRLAPGEYLLAGAVHHIAADGWSVEVFVREFTALYRAHLLGLPDPLPALPIQYADFAVWQRHWLTGDVLETQLRAWDRMLACLSELELPTDRERPDIETFRGDSHRFTIPAAIAEPLRAFGRANASTLFMTLLAGFKALLHRYTGQDHIAVGAPIAGRNRSETEDLIGFFVNSLVLSTDASGDPTFAELAARVRRTALDAFTHQDVPFECLVERRQPERYLNRNPLFQIAFALQQRQAMQPSFDLPGVEARLMPQPHVDVRFDMEVHLWEEGPTIEALLVYNADLFDAATIERLARHYTRLLEAAAANPSARLSEIEYLTAEELRQLEMWS